MILDDIIQHKKRELRDTPAIPLHELERMARRALKPPSFREALAKPGLSVIAEVKRKSPSRGVIRQDFDPQAIARAYRDGGAAAISCLTDEHFFGGSLDIMRQVVDASGLPVLRKDFVIDERQIVEARAFGASAVLLIVAALDEQALAHLFRSAEQWELDALVEVHTPDEARTAVAAGASLIGINNRDLHSFSVSLDTTRQLLHSVDLSGHVVVSESGITTRADAERLYALGIDAILVGEALMAAPDPCAKLREFTGLGGAS